MVGGSEEAATPLTEPLNSDGDSHQSKTLLCEACGEKKPLSWRQKLQTFLPYADFDETARVLDRRRLDNQRLEAHIILRHALGEIVGRGWYSHPAVKMWLPYSAALALYGEAICKESRRRGTADTLLPNFRLVRVSRKIIMPPWIGIEDFHLSHRSNLVRKLPSHYRTFWPDIPADIPYWWPTKELEIEPYPPRDWPDYP